MEFGDGKRAGKGSPPPEPRRGFLSWVFGNRGSSEQKEIEKDEKLSINTGATLTMTAIDLHNDAHGEMKSTTDEEVRSEISRASSSRSRSSRGSRVSRSSFGSRASRTSGRDQGTHWNTFQHGDSIEEGDEENESEFSYFEETFEEMRRRHDIEELAKFPPGQRAQFWVQRRESFKDLPLPPPPTHKMPSKDAPEEQDNLEPTIRRRQDDEDEEALIHKNSENSAHIPIVAPVSELSKKERLAHLRRTMPKENQALLRRTLKEQKKLRKQFKSKLTLVTVKGEKKIPLPRPRDGPPLPGLTVG